MAANRDPRWQLEEHTCAKHEVLRGYLDQWIPIMGHTALKYGEPPPRLGGGHDR